MNFINRLISSLISVLFLAIIFGCQKCPSLFNTTDIQPSYKDDCFCEVSTFFNEETNSCVRFVNCTDVKTTNKQIFSSIKEALSHGPEVMTSLMHGNVEDILSDILPKITLFDDPKGTETLEESKDYEILTEVIEVELGSVFHKYSTYFTGLFNPYLTKSRTITAKCGDDKVCAFKALMQKHKKKIDKIAKGLGPDLYKGFTSVEESLQQSIESECGSGECTPLKKGMFMYKILKQDMATEFKKLSELMAKQFSEHSFSECFNRNKDNDNDEG